MPQALGDFAVNSTLDFKFSTCKADGTPVDMVSGVVSIYKDNDTTQTTTGVTLTVPFDSTTGLANVRVVMTDGFYAAGSNYQAVITTGTVNGISVVGTVLASWSINNRNQAADVTKINSVSAAAARLALSAGVIIPGTVDTGSFSATTTEFESDDITTATAQHYNGRIIIFTSGTLIGQATSITNYSKVGSNGHFAVPALTSAPANNDTFIIL